MDFLLRGVEHLPVGTFELLHQLERIRRVFYRLPMADFPYQRNRAEARANRGTIESESARKQQAATRSVRVPSQTEPASVQQRSARL